MTGLTGLGLGLTHANLMAILFLVSQRVCLATHSAGGEGTTLVIGYVKPPGPGSLHMRAVEDAWAEVEAMSVKAPELWLHFETVEQPYQLTLQDITTALSYVRSRNYSVIAGSENEALRLAAAEENIPYVITSRPSPMTSYLPRHLSLYLWPQQRTIRKAVIDLVQAFIWDHAAVLYSDDEGLHMVGDLMALSNMNIRSWRLVNTDTHSLQRQLLDIRHNNIRKIIVTGTTNNLQALLDEALRLSMLSSLYSWIIADMWSPVDLTPYRYTQVNLTILQLAPSETLNHSKCDLYTSVVMDSLEHIVMAASDLLRMLSSKHVCSSPTCLPLTVPGFQLYTYMKKLIWSGRTGTINFRQDGHFRSNLTLGLLSLNETGLTQIGEWRSDDDNTTETLTFRVRCDKPPSYPPGTHPLGRQVLHIVVMTDAPFVMRKHDFLQRTGNDRYKGFLIDLIQHISVKLSFQYHLYESPDGNYGSKQDGEWNGMIRELIIGNASMCLGAISITSEREEVVDFTKPFMQKTFNILIKKPQEKTSPFQFLWPFSTRIWIFTLSVIILVGCILAGMDRFSPNFEKGSRNKFNLNESIWFTYGSLVGAGTEVFPRMLSGRILSAAWWFFSLILVSSYTANLAAFLTVTRIETPVKTIADLASQTKIRYGTVKDTYAHSLFKNSKIETIQKMWTFMNDFTPDSMVDNTSVGITKVKAGDYAFIWDSPINKYTSLHECDTMVVGEPFDEKGLGIGVPMGAPYRDDVTMAILSLQEEGITQKLIERWWSGGSCSAFKETSTTRTKELDMPNVAGVFLVIAGGAVLAMVVCFLEYIHRLLSRRRLHKDKTCGEALEQESSLPALTNNVITENSAEK